jgi:uncharacterized protein YecE (DUF72 family)
MRWFVGTSGYSYKEWKGTFYPADLPAAKMLSFYAAQFGSVEINNTFYRMPEEKTLATWAGEVPDGFTFVLKAPQWITLPKRIAGAAEPVQRFSEIAATLGEKLGPLFFRFPPDFQKDVEKLRAFLAVVPRERRVVMEFRHESWESDDVYDVLRERDAALCASDTDEVPDPDRLIVATASWGYVRLRRTDYSDAQLAAWKQRIEAQPWSDAYVFFRHEDEGTGPVFAKRFLAQ